MRAFYAISLPETVRDSLADLQAEMGPGLPGIRWVEPGNLHVTLKFLGEIEDSHVEAVRKVLTRAASREPPFRLGLASIGAFASFQRPRVIWVGLAEGREAVARVAGAIEDEGQTISWRREERPFSSHITLARVRPGRIPSGLEERVQGLIWRAPDAWSVSALTLYQSVVGPGGPTYTVVAEAPLTGPEGPVNGPSG